MPNCPKCKAPLDAIQREGTYTLAFNVLTTLQGDSLDDDPQTWEESNDCDPTTEGYSCPECGVQICITEAEAIAFLKLPTDQNAPPAEQAQLTAFGIPAPPEEPKPTFVIEEPLTGATVKTLTLEPRDKPAESG